MLILLVLCVFVIIGQYAAIRSYRRRHAQSQLSDDLLTVTHWLGRQRDPSVHFHQGFPSDRFWCSVRCVDEKGNSVESPRAESAVSAQDAFLKAITEIEKTIGRDWRGYRAGVRGIA